MLVKGETMLHIIYCPEKSRYPPCEYDEAAAAERYVIYYCTILVQQVLRSTGTREEVGRFRRAAESPEGVSEDWKAWGKDAAT